MAPEHRGLREKLAVVGEVVLPGPAADVPGEDVIAAMLARSPGIVESALRAVPAEDTEAYLATLREARPEEFDVLRSFVLGAYLTCPAAWRVPPRPAVPTARCPHRTAAEKPVTPPVPRHRVGVERCECLCAPLGHNPSACRGIAADGFRLPLPGTRGAVVPACPACWAAASRSARGERTSPAGRSAWRRRR
ncbi:hypothetical protein [Amycolatopsis thermophila]|uniref:Uncharacterized protein n=1 Tax=Amycolatopsis thermophila TaxID=206084 RepID=A0ABU0F4L7_9PSEU|nr:hypothetical protein [Amycolatopsis thermophila]MDQ0382520.1 hypothetical protein [Amycolatopsis thermophila]